MVDENFVLWYVPDHAPLIESDADEDGLGLADGLAVGGVDNGTVGVAATGGGVGWTVAAIVAEAVGTVAGDAMLGGADTAAEFDGCVVGDVVGGAAVEHPTAATMPRTVARTGINLRTPIS